MAKFTFEAPRGSRMLRVAVIGISTEVNDKGLWWSRTYNKWMPSYTDLSEGNFSNMKDCRSFKAFKRHIRKHSAYLEKPTFYLHTRFHDVAYSEDTHFKYD